MNDISKTTSTMGYKHVARWGGLLLKNEESL